MIATTLIAQESPPLDDIRDIVVLAPKDSIWPLLTWIFLLLLFSLTVFLLLRKLLRKPTGGNVAPERRAAGRLRELSRLQDSLDGAPFAQSLSELLKDFLSEKYDDPVRYETANEFLERMKNGESGLPEESQRDLATFLASTEEIKFANQTRPASELDPLLDLTRKIVSETAQSASKQA